MSYRERVLKRVGFAILSIYLVMTVAFMFVALTPDPNLGVVAYGAREAGTDDADTNEALATYKEAHNLNDPVHERYLRWLVDVSTLDWGRSFAKEAPVTDILARAIPATLGYVVPGILLATIPGILLGVATAIGDSGVAERLANLTAYVGLGLPNFWLAAVLPVLVADYAGWLRTVLRPHPFVVGSVPFTIRPMPALVLATTLFASWVRYARAESSEYVNAEFVKTLRSKGAGSRALGRHVLRNAALPLVTLFATDLVSVLVLHVYVLEHVFWIPGLGKMGYLAVQQRDMPLIVGTTMVIAIAGILVTTLQDLLEPFLDPRIE